MIKYPMEFKVSSSSLSAVKDTWFCSAESQHHKIPVAIPPEFMGPGGGWSPEDIYAAALQNCFIATFKVFAEKSRLQFQDIQTKGNLIVDRDSSGRPWMSKLHLLVQLTGVEQKNLAENLLEKVSKSCMILNSVKTEVSFQFEIMS